MAVFSVIIALFNKQEHIGKTLESIFCQTFTDFEVIVIDDGSTDGSAAVVKTFTDPRLTYRKINNSGVSFARNEAIRLAAGKLLAFIDADDHWEPNHLHVLYDLHLNNPTAGLLASRYIVKMSDRSFIHPTFKNVPDSYSGLVSDFFGSSLTNRIACASAVAVPREVFDVVGNFNTKLTRTEDTELWLRIALQYPVAISNKCTARYNYDLPVSLSKTQVRNSVIMDFNEYTAQELVNPGLKAFLDIYRIEYALKFRLEGDLQNSKKLYEQAAPENINPKVKLLFAMPASVLRKLLHFKHWLHKQGIVLSVYR